MALSSLSAALLLSLAHAEPSGSAAHLLEPSLLSAHLRVAVATAGDRPAPFQVVTIDYRLNLAGRDKVPVTLLEIGGSLADHLKATWQGRLLEMERPETRPLRQQFQVCLPEAARGLDTLDLRLTYEVDSSRRNAASAERLTLPIAAVAWPSTNDQVASFIAEVRLPTGWSLYDGFPTGFAQPTAARESWRAELPVVPSFLDFRAREGKPPPWRLERFVDLGAAAMLIVLAGFAWFRIRRIGMMGVSG